MESEIAITLEEEALADEDEILGRRPAARSIASITALSLK